MKNMKSNKMNNYVLILAGGNGTRLWPISTSNKPKQFLNLYSDNIMINETIIRVKEIFEYKNIFVIVNKKQEELAKKYIDYNIPRKNIICEPFPKNTAMCILYASVKIKKIRGNGIMTILSSDHYIKEKNKLQINILEGIKIAKKSNNLVTIGIKPTYPATGFGYIKFNYDNNKECNVVEEFKEKPNYYDACKYVESKNYYWNSGMFVWEIDTILNNYKIYLPDLYKYKEELENAIEKDSELEQVKNIYNKVLSISIDKGILEKSKNIKMVKGKFEWLDVGSINDFFKIRKKDEFNNTKIGNVLLSDTENTNIYNENEDNLIVTIGLENLNVINCNKVILIGEKDKMNKLTNILKKMKKDKKYEKFL